MEKFKFQPHERVKIKPLGTYARVERCVKDAGPMPSYGVVYILDGELRRHEFYEDELELEG